MSASASIQGFAASKTSSAFSANRRSSMSAAARSRMSARSEAGRPAHAGHAARPAATAASASATVARAQCPMTCEGRAGLVEATISRSRIGLPPITIACRPPSLPAAEESASRMRARLASRLKSVLGAFEKPGARAWRAAGALEEEVDGIAKEHLAGGAARVLRPQEALVGGVLEEPAHEVGHAGQQVADRAVLPHAPAARHQRRLELVRHPVEGLELVGPRVDPEPLGLRDRVRAGADVVRGEGGRRDVGVLEEQHRQLLEVGVALGLLGPDRNGPAPLAGERRLEVPVGALHQAHHDRAVRLAGPCDQVAEVALAVTQVGLDGDADGGRLAELVLGEDGLEERERQVLQPIALHVEVDERAVLAGLP